MEKKTDTAADKAETVGELTVKCGSCSTDQAVTHKCCSECGQLMAKANKAAFDAALEELDAFHKANTALPDKPEVAAGDHSTVETTIKAATAAGDDSALVELLIGGQNRNTDHLVAVGGDTRAVRIGLGQIAGLMVKAFSAGFAAHEERFMGAIDGLIKRVDAWESQPGRSRSAAVTTTLKAAPGADVGEDDSLRGELLIKAAVGLVAAGKLNTTEATLTQQYANRGATLDSLAQHEPALHARLTAGLAATGAAH